MSSFYRMNAPAKPFLGKTIFVSGAAGFIGTFLVLKLLREAAGAKIVGVDNLNDYYEVSLKEYRLRQIEKAAEASSCTWTFIRGSIADKALVDRIAATRTGANDRPVKDQRMKKVTVEIDE